MHFVCLTVCVWACASMIGGLADGSDRTAEGKREGNEILKPPALKPGDTIAFVAPAGAAELPPLLEYKKRLEKRYIVAVPPESKPVKLVGGKARGRLLGGNLSLICATIGTPYAIEPEGIILFVEDVHEAPYRVDRMLSQLRLAGVLDAVSGVV